MFLIFLIHDTLLTLYLVLDLPQVRSHFDAANCVIILDLYIPIVNIAVTTSHIQISLNKHIVTLGYGALMLFHSVKGSIHMNHKESDPVYSPSVLVLCRPMVP